MLNRTEISEIEEKADQERGKYSLGLESPIGSNIFSVIETQYKKMLMLYPINSLKIAGFTRKNGEIIQIFINTSFNKSFQIFVAAHELYHVLQFEQKNSPNFVICSRNDVSELIDDNMRSRDELKANYFAAAFLLPQNVVKKRFNNITSYSFDDLVLDILKVEYEYEVPYKSVVKRLKELEVLKNENLFNQLILNESNLSYYYKMLEQNMINKINELECVIARRYHSLNVPKIAVDDYKGRLITFSKLESIIGNYDKKISDFGIEEYKIEPLDLDFFSFGEGGEFD